MLGAPSPADAPNTTEAPTAVPRPAFLPRLTLGKHFQSAHAAGSPPVFAPERPAASSPSKRTPPGKDSVEALAIPSSEAASLDAAQPRPVLRLRGTLPANATTATAPGQAKQHQEPPHTAIETSPRNAVTAQPPATPLHRTPEAAPAVVGLKNAEHQGHPSTTPDRTPAAPITANWPELAPRPAPQPTAETATAAMARAARLSDEQLAV
ncbi:hypothetical protein [Arthrobacter sp. FW306-04-A]|uniref:hypothetical protein n=1 Tax=Arthrobacter sp. FW306-04-A TaxID=2879619 RepID=UPI0037BFE062|nr:hypothetical protein LFT43_18465 [Arthrobacter sp. FW306-04-A]